MKLHIWRGYVTFASKQKTDLTGLGSFRTRSGGGGTPSFTSGGSYPFWNKIYKFGENSKQYTNTYQYMHPMSPFNVPDYICGDPDAGMPIFGIQNVGLFSVCPVCGLRRGIPPNDVSCWGFPCVGPRLLALSLLHRISPRILEFFSNVLQAHNSQERYGQTKCRPVYNAETGAGGRPLRFNEHKRPVGLYSSADKMAARPPF